ncbi:MAG: C39 family peptidase [Candidatus Zixiibacteriota bacterium]|nr:MAG: C39 family peptidase [candidate division Zixibacteria bacterium]
MLKRIVFVLAVVVVFAPSVQAEELISPSDAQETADRLIQRNFAYYSAHPERVVDNFHWESLKAASPILVHSYPDLKPCYYVVPAVSPDNWVVALIGASAKSREWQWYTRVELERYPRVSKNEALQICQQRAQDAETSEPKIVEMPDKNFYWFCTFNHSNLPQLFININQISDVRTSQDPRFLDASGRHAPPEIDSPTPEERAEPMIGVDHRYPDFYNMEVPFYFQDSSYYCGEASLEMVFDYWGPDINQDDIGFVADVMPGLGTNRTNVIRASHFSWISTAILNPALHGYNERSLGYCGIYQSWNRISHFVTRYEDLKTLISSDYPVLVLTWYSASHSAGHYRVVKGYDENLDVFIVHDPWYTPPYSGPDFHFNQAFLVDDLWLLSDRWGLFSAVWRVDLVADSLVGTEQLFTVSAEFEYRGPHPFENQYPADSIQATIVLPSGYQIVDPPSATIYFDSQASGYTDSAVWQVLSPALSSGRDTIRVEAKGKITGSSNSYPSYQDWIGGTGEVELTTVIPLRGDANGDEIVDVGDVVYIVNFLYRNGNPPVPLQAADANCDGIVDIGDVVYLINYLYRGGDPPGCP